MLPSQSAELLHTGGGHSHSLCTYVRDQSQSEVKGSRSIFCSGQTVNGSSEFRSKVKI